MAEVNPTSYGAVGIALEGMCALFAALRLTHVISWSSWWVLAPVWIPAALVVLVLAGGFAVAIYRAAREGADA